MQLAVILKDGNGNVVARYQGRAELVMAFALRFVYLHGLDPDAAGDPGEGIRTCSRGSIHFWPAEIDDDLEGAAELMAGLKRYLDELDYDSREES